MKTAAMAASAAIQVLTTKAETSPDYSKRSAEFARWLGFETFDDPELEKVVIGAMQWSDAFRDKRNARWLSLIGASGCGKTHCAQRLWTWAKDRADWSKCEFLRQWIYWPSFVQRLRAGNRFEMREDMKKWPVLFLDDVGAERDPSGFATEELHTLLGCRMGKWTLITSNKSFEALEQLDARITSRLIRDNNICVGINTKDFSER